jgi:hypothetical protein
MVPSSFRKRKENLKKKKSTLKKGRIFVLKIIILKFCGGIFTIG